MELPSIAGLREAMQSYGASLRSSSAGHLLISSVLNGIVTAAVSGFVLTFVALSVVEKTTGKMGEFDGAIVAGFLFFVLAGTGFVAGFSATLGIARRRVAFPVLATFATLLLTASSWFATAQLAQILWWVTPLAIVGISTLVLLPLRRAN